MEVNVVTVVVVAAVQQRTVFISLNMHFVKHENLITVLHIQNSKNIEQRVDNI